MLKKLLLVAFVTLFAVAAFAEAKTSVWGTYNLAGRFVDNYGYTEGDAVKSVNFYTHYLEIWGSMEVPGFKATVMINPFDHVVGNFLPFDGGTLASVNSGQPGDGLPGVVDGSTAANLGIRAGTVDMRRAFATWTILPGLSLTGGLVTAGEYDYKGAFSGYYNGLFLEHDAGEGVVVAYSLNKDNAVFLAVEKYQDGAAATTGIVASVTGVPATEYYSQDSEAYILGANLKFGDIVLNPRVSYTSIAPVFLATVASIEKRSTVTGAYLGGGLNPSSGVFVNAAFAFTSAGGDEAFKDSFGGFGVYLNPGLTSDIGTIGLDIAYGSYSSKDDGATQKAFGFGGSFDRTIIIDQGISYLGSKNSSIGAMTTVQAYADLKLVPGLTISPRVAYYLSNVKKDEFLGGLAGGTAGSGNQYLTGNKTNYLEADLVASFALSDYTSLSAGIAYATFSKVYSAANVEQDIDAVTAALWKIETNF